MKKLSKSLLTVGILVMAIAAAVFVIGATGGEKPKADAATAPRTVAVYLAPIEKSLFEERLEVSGNVDAKVTAWVSARVPGTLDQIDVDEGDAVEAGRTKLFQTDQVKLTKALAAAQQQVSVGRAEVEVQRATVARINADLAKVQLDYDRYRRLYEQDQAITQSAMEMQESVLLQTKADRVEAQARVALAEAQMQQAESALAIAEKDLSDSLVIAPISGAVSVRRLEPGEMANAGTPVLRIDDLSVLEVSAFLPQESYDRVVPGQTPVHLMMGADDLGAYPLSYRSPTIDPQRRTFEVKMRIDKPIEGLVPGRLVRLAVILQSTQAMGVPTDAIVRRADEDVLFVLDGQRVKKVAVRTGLETGDRIQIASDQLQPGMMVVSKGQQFCNDGDTVRVIEESR